MVCYAKSDKFLKAARIAHLSDEVKTAISDDFKRNYESQVRARSEKENEEFARRSKAQETENARLARLGLSLSTRAEELKGRERDMISTEQVAAELAERLYGRKEVLDERESGLQAKTVSLSTKEQEVTGLVSELDNRKRQQEAQDLVIAEGDAVLSAKETEVTDLASELAQQKRRQEEMELELGGKGAVLLMKETEVAGLAFDLDLRKDRQEQRDRELSGKDMALFTRELEIAGQTSELQEERRRQGKRDRQLSNKEAKLTFKELQIAGQAGEVKREKAKLQETALRLKREAERLSAKERALEEQKRREEAERRRRYQEAEARIGAAEVGFNVAHCEEVARWQEGSYQRAKKAVSQAKGLLRAGDMPKALLTVERATAELERLERQAFKDQLREDERKKVAGITLAALGQLGYLRVGAKMRNKADPRSQVDIVGVLPSGKWIILTMFHDGTMEIRQRGVSGHQECHSIEDAIVSITKGMGLTFGGGHKATTRKRRPAGPRIRVATTTKRKASD